jgi:AcrR family transcriptional regulator
MTKKTRKSRRGIPKGDKRARTRATLIAAATEVVREKGYEGTTQEDIAQRACMTRGAVQGNFKDKDEIFFAIATTRWAPIAPKFESGGSLSDFLHSMAVAVIAAMPDRRSAAIGFTSFTTYALRHETLRAKVVEQIAGLYEWSANWIVTQIPQSDLPMPAAIFVRVIHAVTEGLTYQRFLTPELVNDEVIHAAFAVLAGGPAKQQARKRRAR